MNVRMATYDGTLPTYDSGRLVYEEIRRAFYREYRGKPYGVIWTEIRYEGYGGDEPYISAGVDYTLCDPTAYLPGNYKGLPVMSHRLA